MKKAFVIITITFFAGVWVGSAFTDLDALATCVARGTISINELDVVCQVIRPVRI